MGVWTATTLFLLDTRTMIDELFPTEGSFAEEVVEGNDLSNKIAIFDVEGTILDTGEQTSILSGASTYNHRSFLDKLDMAAKDKNIKGVILRINSPGGGVLESAEVYDKILEVKEQENQFMCQWAQWLHQVDIIFLHQRIKFLQAMKR